MSKSYNRIVMDFRKAKEQASKLEAQARRMSTLANEQFGGVIRSVGKNWTGENADAYLAKCETLKRKMLQSAEDLKRSAATIRVIAKNTYEAEMEAWRIAHRRRD